jgi:YHS domain-containing protein
MSHIPKNILLVWIPALSAAAILSLSLGAFSQGSVYQTKDGAIRGYDPVAYFTLGKPVKGSARYTVDWHDATWCFSSQENLEAFKKDPDAFAPRYGGYCAYGIAEGDKVSSKPECWAIVDGKLYLNYNEHIQKKWERDIQGYIEQANGNWSKILPTERE